MGGGRKGMRGARGAQEERSTLERRLLASFLYASMAASFCSEEPCGGSGDVVSSAAACAWSFAATLASIFLSSSACAASSAAFSASCVATSAARAACAAANASWLAAIFLRFSAAAASNAASRGGGRGLPRRRARPGNLRLEQLLLLLH